MKTDKIISILLAGALVCLAAFSLGCPDRGPDPAKTRQKLLDRAQAFWNAKAKKDFQTSYVYLEPEWKARLPMTDWAGSFGLVDWANPEVLDCKIEGSLAIVAVRFDYEIKGTFAAGEKGETTAHEYWVQVGDVWYKEEPGVMETPSWEKFPEREGSPVR